MTYNDYNDCNDCNDYNHYNHCNHYNHYNQYSDYNDYRDRDSDLDLGQQKLVDTSRHIVTWAAFAILAMFIPKCTEHTNKFFPPFSEKIHTQENGSRGAQIAKFLISNLPKGSTYSALSNVQSTTVPQCSEDAKIKR